MKYIDQVVNLLPKLMSANGIELNKENFMRHLQASFEFIDDLTQLPKKDITLLEYYLFGMPAIESLLPKNTIDLLEEITDSLRHISPCSATKRFAELFIEGLQSLVISFGETFQAEKETLSNEVKFIPTFFKFADNGSITLKDESINRYAKEYSSIFNQIADVVDGYYEKLFGVKNIGKNYSGCPAKSVVLKVDGQDVNLIKALYDYFVRQLEKLPNLDQLIKEAAIS